MLTYVTHSAACSALHGQRAPCPWSGERGCASGQGALTSRAISRAAAHNQTGTQMRCAGILLFAKQAAERHQSRNARALLARRDGPERGRRRAAHQRTCSAMRMHA